MADENTSYHVIIVGGGVSGALVAWQLTQTLRHRDTDEEPRVLLLEAGPALPDPHTDPAEVPSDVEERLLGVNDWALDDAQLLGAPYNRRNNKLAPSPEEDLKHSWYEQMKAHTFRGTYERRWGGTTWHWMGLMPRLLPSDFEMRSRYGVAVDWPITYDDLEPWYALAERELGVSGDHAQWDGVHGAWRSEPFPMSEIWPSYGDEAVRAKLDGATFDGLAVKLRTVPQARNSRTYQGRPACAGNSSCIPLCPIGAKYDATVHLRKLAKDARVTLRSGCIVTRVLTGEDGRAIGVKYHDARDDRTARRTALCDVLVLAGNAIETPRLLLASGLLTSNPNLGANLMDHLNRASYIEASEPVWGYRGPPTTSGIDAFRDGPFRRERAAFRISVGNDGGGRTRAPQVELASLLASSRGENGSIAYGLPLRNALRERMSRLFRLSCLAEVLPSAANRVTLGAKLDDLDMPKPALYFDPGEYALTGVNRADAVLRSLLSRVGDPSSLSPPSSPDQWDTAGHILGTARMGVSAADGVVDRDGRVFGIPNLFIADGSVFPTQGTANPTATIAALALRLGTKLARDEITPILKPAVVKASQSSIEKAQQ
jgi:choline dehydrogenase-like flavoprotein